MEQLEKAIRVNQLAQQKERKKKYTKPDLFVKIEQFIREKQLIGYGGTAIHHALPKEVQFYKSSDVPDYDFFSIQAIQDIRELADRLSDFPNVEVKPAIFKGTYKLFVNYLPLVDMTQIEPELFHNLWVSSFSRDKIHYVPYNYLRMSIYQELSRPFGDVSRWTKIYQRLDLLNTYQPFLVRKCDVTPTRDTPNPYLKEMVSRLKSYVMLGDYAMYYWQELFPEKYRYPQQDTVFVLSKTIDEIWSLLKGWNVKYTLYQNKLIQLYEVYLEEKPMLYVILSDSCANYNVYKGRKIASYDTTLSLYFTLSFMQIKHLVTSRILSYCYLLLQIKEDHPLMRRFSLPCYGDQQTLEEIRKRRDRWFKQKKHASYFFQYRPRKMTQRTQQKLTRKQKKKIR